jgi:hypothetical protein
LRARTSSTHISLYTLAANASHLARAFDAIYEFLAARIWPIVHMEFHQLQEQYCVFCNDSIRPDLLRR